MNEQTFEHAQRVRAKLHTAKSNLSHWQQICKADELRISSKAATSPAMISGDAKERIEQALLYEFQDQVDKAQAEFDAI